MSSPPNKNILKLQCRTNMRIFLKWQSWAIRNTCWIVISAQTITLLNVQSSPEMNISNFFPLFICLVSLTHSQKKFYKKCFISFLQKKFFKKCFISFLQKKWETFLSQLKVFFSPSSSWFFIYLPEPVASKQILNNN